MSVWDQTKIQQFIDNGVEESLTLDYKAAGALDKTDGKKAEITKDVSAMANSAGGLIIYGVKEFDNKAKAHLPERIDPVSRTSFPKEWLEQVISTIRPRIENLIIHPVPTSGSLDQVVYVVEAPQSDTAHQAKDLRYYRRYNFESVPMTDHEIRDVMGRVMCPSIEIQLCFILFYWKRTNLIPLSVVRGSDSPMEVLELVVSARNIGKVLAKYVNCYLSLPERFCTDDPEKMMFAKPSTNEPQTTIRATNTARDITGYEMCVPKYGPYRYDPILPDMVLLIHKHRIYPQILDLDLQKEPGVIRWTVHADNAPSRTGEIAIKDIPVEDKRKGDE